MAARRRGLWSPSFSPEIQGWSRRYIGRNAWRTIPVYDEDDLFQEAFLIFIMLKDRYPGVVDPPHFMRLFQVSFANHLHDLATLRTKEARSHACVRDEDGAERPLLEVLPDTRGAPVRYDKMSHALHRLVEYAEQKGRPRVHQRRSNGRRMTTNEFLCAIARLPQDVDLRGQLSTFIQEYC